MTRAIVRFVVALSGLAIGASGAVESIGFTYSSGAYRVAGETVRGNATILEGDTLAAGDAPVTVHLNRGARIWVSPGSRVKIASGRAELLRGAAQLQAPPRFTFEARSVRIAAADVGAMLRVLFDEQGGTVVAAAKGGAFVTNSRGVRVAALLENHAVRFTDARSAVGVKLSGCLTSAAGRFFLTDAVTNLKVQLIGAGLDRAAGHAVNIIGREENPAPAAIMLVSVDRSELVSAAECNPEAGASSESSDPDQTGGQPQGGGSPKGPHHNLSTRVKVAIIGGVAATGTVVGLAAAGVFSGGENTASR